MASLDRRLNQLQSQVDDLISGAYPMRSALGPGAIQKNFIRSKTVTSNMIDVSNLEAVSTKTGSLNVDGNIVVGAGGAIRSGMTAFNDITNTGYWIGIDGGVPKFKLGDDRTSTSPLIVWNGTGLTVRGVIQAESGYLKTLSVDGNITVGSAGAIRGGKTSASSTTAGFWLGNDSGTYRLNIGNAVNNLLWDGSNLTINGTVNINGASTFTGAVTVSTGSFNLSGTTPHIRSGQTAYNTGTGFFLGNVGGSPRLSVGNGTQGFTWNGSTLAVRGDFVADTIDANSGTLGGLTIDGTITVGAQLQMATGGVIRSGATSITAGTGYWIEHNAGTPRFRIGQAVSAGNKYLYWDGSNLTVRGRLEFGTGDFLDNDIIHFDTGSVYTTNIEFNRSGQSPTVDIATIIGTAEGGIQITARGSTANRVSRIQALGGGNTPQAYLYSEFSTNTALIATLATTSGAEIFLTLDVTHDVLHATDTDTAFALNGTAGGEQFSIRDSGGNRLFAIASNGAIIIDSHATNGPLFLSGASGAMPNPTKYLRIVDEDTLTAYYIPVFSGFNGWAA